MSLDLIASQLPVANDYVELIKTHWNASRHPENIQDIVQAGRESVREFGYKEKAILLGTLGLEFVELSPLNEMLLNKVGGEVLHQTGQELVTIFAVGATTGSLELAIGGGMAYSLQKFRPSVDIIRERYINKHEEGMIDDETTGLSPAKKYGLAALTGAAGYTIYHDLMEQGRELTDNLKSAAAASGMLALGNAGLAVIFVGTAAAAEKAGVDGAVDSLADLARGPLFPLGFFSVFIGVNWWRRRKQKRHSVIVENNDMSTITGSKITPDGGEV